MTHRLDTAGNDVRRWLARGLPWLLLGLALLLVALQVRRPAALVRVGVPWAETGTVAVAMTAVIIAGGIDLSVGSIAALSGMVLAVAWKSWGLPPVAAGALALTVSGGCGLINGGLIATGLSPLVTTLATMATYGGLALALSGGQRITDLPQTWRALTQIGGVPAAYLLLAAASGVGLVVLNRVPLGRAVYALGDNRRAARLAAVPVRRVECWLYVASGLTAGIVGLVYAVDRDAAVPDAHKGIELRAIACVVVGGTSIAGGRGGIGRTLLGIAVVALLDVGLEFLGGRLGWVTAEARLVVVGFLLIAVAACNETCRR